MGEALDIVLHGVLPGVASSGDLGPTAQALGQASDTAINAAGAEAGVGALGALGSAGASAGAGAATDAGFSAAAPAATDFSSAGLAATDAATAAGSAGVNAGISGGLAEAAAADAAIPTVTISGSAPAASGIGDFSGINAAGLGAGVAAGLAGSGGGAGASNDQALARKDAVPADAGGFLPATVSSDIGSLSPDLASSLGIDTGSMPSIAGGGGDFSSSFPSDISSFSPQLQDVSGSDLSGLAGPGPGGGGGLMDWLAKNPRTAVQLGISGYNALNKPKLPSAANTALNAAGPAVQQAQAIISSGGTATPAWSQQKAGIDARIDQQIQQQTEAVMQAAANSGEGNQNSGIVQQQIAQMTANLNEQRQQLYLQAQQQNVNNAVSELTGGNQTLSSIAQMQLAQEQEARQTATQTAQLAMQLEQLSQSGG